MGIPGSTWCSWYVYVCFTELNFYVLISTSLYFKILAETICSIAMGYKAACFWLDLLEQLFFVENKHALKINVDVYSLFI